MGALADNYSALPGVVIRGGRFGPAAWVSAQAVNTWAQIGNTPNTVDPANDAAINPNGAGVTPPWRDNSIGNSGFQTMMTAWSGGAYNTDTDDLVCMGEGHTDGYGNQLAAIAMNVGTPAWRLETWPTGAIGNKLHPGDAPGALVTMIGDGHAAWVSGAYADGRPRGNHTYNNLVFAHGDLYLIPVGGPAPEPGFNLNCFKYGGTTKTWSRITSPSYALLGDSGGGACFDPIRNAIFYFSYSNKDVAKYDIATDSWSATGHSVNSGAYHRPIYIPGLDIIVTISLQYTRRFAIYDYGVTAGAIPTPAATGTPPTTTGSTGVWVPELGAVAVWNGGTGFYLLTPPAGATQANAASGTWAWSRLEAAAGNTITPPVPHPNGTFGRLFYSPTLKIIGVITAVDQRMHAFRVA